MSSNDLVQQFSQPEFLSEIHHLFWIKPFINHGVPEPGWSCRDHAMALGIVAAMLGNGVALVTGRASFIQGPYRGISPRIFVQQIHGWFRTASNGTFDPSWRLNMIRNMPKWRPWNAHGVFGGKIHPAGSAEFNAVADLGRYNEIVARSKNIEDGRSAVYLNEHGESLSSDLVAGQYDWVNSPLTERLRKIGPHLYSAAACHLLQFLEDGLSLRNLEQDAAWKHLAERYPDALQRTKDNLIKFRDETGVLSVS